MLKLYLLIFLVAWLRACTDVGEIGNDLFGVFSLTGTRLATVEDRKVGESGGGCGSNARIRSFSRARSLLHGRHQTKSETYSYPDHKHPLSHKRFAT